MGRLHLWSESWFPVPIRWTQTFLQESSEPVNSHAAGSHPTVQISKVSPHFYLGPIKMSQTRIRPERNRRFRKKVPRAENLKALFKPNCHACWPTLSIIVSMSTVRSNVDWRHKRKRIRWACPTPSFYFSILQMQILYREKRQLTIWEVINRTGRSMREMGLGWVTLEFKIPTIWSRRPGHRSG